MENVRLTLDTIANWLQVQVNGHPDFPKFLVTYARQPDMPDRCTTILRVGAGGNRLDGMFEEIPFRLQTRGRSESVEDAERYALLLEDIIDVTKRVTMPVTDARGNALGDVFIADSWEVNKAKQMPMTDAQSRYQFTGDYMFLASRYN